MLDSRTATAAIVGQLIPELEYAAPVLLERLEQGLPLVERRSPSELGFDPSIDAHMLELFRSIVPHISTLLSCGLLGMLQTWLLHAREQRSQEELRRMLQQLQAESAKVRLALEKLRAKVSDELNVPVTQTEIDDAIREAITRLSLTQP